MRTLRCIMVLACLLIFGCKPVTQNELSPDAGASDPGDGLACAPGDVNLCYSGSIETIGVGHCRVGTEVCHEDGLGFDECAGEVLPSTEDCGTPDDDDCDGVSNEGCSYASCLEILEANPGSPSGMYDIDPDSDGPREPFPVFCDMQTDGGGWTLLARSFGGFQLTDANQWIDILSANYYSNTSVLSGAPPETVTSEDVPPDYHERYSFFALLHAAAELDFLQVRFHDGILEHVQSMAQSKSMAQIHGEDGVETLFQDGEATGVLLALGNASHTSNFPCVYPEIDTESCYHFFDGDTGSETTAFFVGDLAACSDGPWPDDPARALWGSRDCYEIDGGGGYAGFWYSRPYHEGRGAVGGGYHDAPWTLYVR